MPIELNRVVAALKDNATDSAMLAARCSSLWLARAALLERLCELERVTVSKHGLLHLRERERENSWLSVN